MSPLIIGILGIVVLMVLLLLGMPIGVTMGLVGVGGLWVLLGADVGLSILQTAPFDAIATFDYALVPLFVLMGSFCFQTGVSKHLYYAVNAWIGHYRGGLAMATVGACAGFAAVSGSSLATTATLGTVAMPEMKKYKYDMALSTGVISAGGTLGILIPPSVVLVVYGILTETSIAELFIAGIVPGALQAVFYIITISIVCRINPLAGPAGHRSSYKERFNSLKEVWPIVTLFSIVIGGIYTGIFSPGEAAAVGAFSAMVIAIVQKKLTRKNFGLALDDSLKTTGMIFTIMIGAIILGYFFAATRLPFDLAEIVGGWKVSKYVVFGAILSVYLILGCIMIPMAMVILTLPIVFPLVQSLGFDAVWFGIITVKIFEIAQITPPVGMNVFIMKGVAPDVPLTKIFRGIFPFLISDIVQIILLILFPQIVLWLPNLLR